MDKKAMVLVSLLSSASFDVMAISLDRDELIAEDMRLRKMIGEVQEEHAETLREVDAWITKKKEESPEFKKFCEMLEEDVNRIESEHKADTNRLREELKNWESEVVELRQEADKLREKNWRLRQNESLPDIAYASILDKVETICCKQDYVVANAILNPKWLVENKVVTSAEHAEYVLELFASHSIRKGVFSDDIYFFKWGVNNSLFCNGYGLEWSATEILNKIQAALEKGAEMPSELDDNEQRKRNESLSGILKECILDKVETVCGEADQDVFNAILDPKWLVENGVVGSTGQAVYVRELFTSNSICQFSRATENDYFFVYPIDDNARMAICYAWGTKWSATKIVNKIRTALGKA